MLMSPSTSLLQLRKFGLSSNSGKYQSKKKSVDDIRLKMAMVKDLMRVHYKNNATGKIICLVGI